MNEIFKNLLITISSGGDNTGGGSKLIIKNQNPHSEQLESGIEKERGGGAGNDPTENILKPNNNL